MSIPQALGAQNNTDTNSNSQPPDEDLAESWAALRPPPPPVNPAVRSVGLPPPASQWGPPWQWLRDMPAWLATLKRRPLNREHQGHVRRLLGSGGQPRPQELLLPDPNIPGPISSAAFVFGSALATSFDTVGGLSIASIERILRSAGIRSTEGPFPEGAPVVLAYIDMDPRPRVANVNRGSQRVARFAVGFALPDTGMPGEWFSYVNATHLVSYTLPNLRSVNDFVLYTPDP